MHLPRGSEVPSGWDLCHLLGERSRGSEEKRNGTSHACNEQLPCVHLETDGEFLSGGVTTEEQSPLSTPWCFELESSLWKAGCLTGSSSTDSTRHSSEQCNEKLVHFMYVCNLWFVYYYVQWIIVTFLVYFYTEQSGISTRYSTSVNFWCFSQKFTYSVQYLLLCVCMGNVVHFLLVDIECISILIST